MNRYDQGWRSNSPIPEIERRQGLRWARLVLGAQVVIGLLVCYTALHILGIILIGIQP